MTNSLTVVPPDLTQPDFAPNRIDLPETTSDLRKTRKTQEWFQDDPPSGAHVVRDEAHAHGCCIVLGTGGQGSADRQGSGALRRLD